MTNKITLFAPDGSFLEFSGIPEQRSSGMPNWSTHDAGVPEIEFRTASGRRILAGGALMYVIEEELETPSAASESRVEIPSASEGPEADANHPRPDQPAAE